MEPLPAHSNINATPQAGEAAPASHSQRPILRHSGQAGIIGSAGTATTVSTTPVPQVSEGVLAPTVEPGQGKQEQRDEEGVTGAILSGVAIELDGVFPGGEVGLQSSSGTSGGGGANPNAMTNGTPGGGGGKVVSGSRQEDAAEGGEAGRDDGITVGVFFFGG